MDIPVTHPPATDTPTTQPPVTEPSQPPVTQPPVTDTPVTQPPVTQPPVTQPPVTQPPVTQPPVTQPPVTQPPVTQPPVTQPPVTVPPVPQPPALSEADLIAEALRTGNSSKLPASATSYLLQSGAYGLAQTRKEQQDLVAALIDDTTAAALNFTAQSHNVRPLIATAASPLLVSNNGNVLASISNVSGIRAAGYGKDLINGLSTAGGSNEAQMPLFTRTFTWLVTGKPQGSLPATVRVATQNFDFNTVAKFVARLGAKAEDAMCNLADSANTCWQNADLLIFGQNTPASAGLTPLVASYLQAGKPVLYQHGNWVDSAGGRQVLQAMGMQLGDYPGNYYAAPDDIQISATRTAAQQRQATDHLAVAVSAVNQLANGATVDFSQDQSLAKGLDTLRNNIASLDSRGLQMFADTYAEKPYLDAHRRLVLWADMYREQVDYSQVRRSNATPFLSTLAADTFTTPLRPMARTPKTFGDWMPASAPQLVTSADWETVDVTIAQGSGRTAIGRAAVPGKAVEVEIADAAGASLALRIGQIRTRGNPLVQENYTRPRYPDGHYAKLPAGKVQTYTTAWGGPLFLDYSSATPGTVVKLRIRNSAKYAHFDFTRTMPQAEIDEAVQALKRADFGWQTAKMVGGEVQQTIGFAKSAIGNRTPEEYVQVRLKGMIFDSNHLANGYNNMPASANVTNVCASLGWDCTSNVHRAPGVQHFVGWLAACGFLCSGNPSDGAAAINPGWGWWHELGHNTVPRHMTLTFPGGGCNVECNNNILANASALRQYAMTNGAENNNGTSIEHKRLYQDIAAARATGKTGEDLRLDMFNRFWVGSNQNDQAMRAVHFQLAFIYTRERLGQAQPQPADVIDFLGLLGRGNRLVDNTWSEANKVSLGMGRFTSKTISNHELLYVLSSRIIGRDMRELFTLYGIPLGADALGSIADLKLPVQAPEFYAMVPGQGNKLELGKWMDIAASSPAYPL